MKNGYDNYELMLSLDPYSVNDLLKAHKMMMEGLIPENRKFRSGGVGVFDGDVVVHMAPPARLVPGEIQDLFDWYKSSEIYPLIRSAIFHYEFEFIHPFADGNGRMGRMWHSLLLGKWNEIFYWLPIEELIRSRQQEYYDALGDEELSAAQIMERLDLSHRPTFRKNYLNPALAQGVIEMTIPDRPNSRNQRYRRKQLDR